MIADEPGFRYWGFISYSHQDVAWGRWLHRALETYRIPQRLIGMPIAAGTIPARLTPVFRDRDELPTATDLDRTVAEALRQSWSLIVICSRASAQSRWVNEEVREFQRLGRAGRIHCLIVDESSDAAAAPCFPPALRERPWNGTVAGEPIAADARRSGDGKANARLKLVAGILGISFDKLVQRDQQRGYRRMAMIAIAAISALLLLTVFTVITVTSHRDAEAQRGHAEQLVEFMLGDLRQKLEPEGKLSTLDAVGKEALAYYAAQDPARLDADALARRARALHMIGEVYDQRGRLDDALGVFKQAAYSTGELLSRDKENPQRIFDHAQSFYWVGLIAWRRGHFDDAEANFQQYLTMAKTLVSIAPEKPEWQSELGNAESNLGTLLLDRGRIDDATQAFENALETSRALSSNAPDDEQRKIELAQSYAWSADALAAQGHLSQAIDRRQAEVAIYEEILSLNKQSGDAKSSLAVAERALGGLSLSVGNVTMAVAQLRRAVVMAEEAIAIDADNLTNIDIGAKVYSGLGRALYEAGEIAGAKTALARARDLATRLVQRDASVVAWQIDLSRALMLQARVSATESTGLDTLRSLQGALQRLESLEQTNRTDREVRSLHASVLVACGEEYGALGNREQADDAWKRAIALSTPGYEHAEPRVRADVTIALRHLRRGDEAANLFAGLENIGYRDPEFLRSWARMASDESVSHASTTNARRVN